MDDIHEWLAEQAALIIGGGCWAKIYAGQLIVEAVGFERQSAHDRLAWVETDHEGHGFFLDIGAIYAVEEIDPKDIA